MNAIGNEAMRALVDARKTNPFVTTAYMINGEPRVLGEITAEDRQRAVKTFNAVDCELALALPDLQKTVLAAIERRLRKLQKAGETA